MKFGKEFKRQMVPEWVDAYMDYNGLKRILREFLQYKHQRHKQQTPSRGVQLRLTLHRALSGQSLRSGNISGMGDIEEQVINVNALDQQDGSRKCYKTEFLRQCEDGGIIEARFFKKLDGELNKVNGFYEDKVHEMMREADVLAKQMDATTALRIMVEKPDNLSTATMTGSDAFVTQNPSRSFNSNRAQNSGAESKDKGIEVDVTRQTVHSAIAENGREHIELTIETNTGNSSNREQSTSSLEVTEVQRTNGFPEEKNINDYKQNPLKILEHVKIRNTRESPLSTIKGVLMDSKEEELRFKKEELRKVEEQLQVVFIEFYQKLRLLKHYCYMNLAAFSKIMKKYDKITSRRATRSYMKIVDNSFLGSSDEVINLLERVEITFINHFSNANRREGMKMLRSKVKKEKHSVTFFSGFFSGCSIALLVAAVLKIQSRQLLGKAEGTSYVVNIFPLYSLFAYTCLHMLMYAADIYFWRRYRVNYPFIFGFKQGTELSHREVFLLSNGFAVLALASFLTDLYLDTVPNASNYKTLTQLVPLSVIIVVLAMLFCPFGIIYRSSRLLFVKCLFRCICAPLYKVTLPDFFLGDNLASQVQAIRCIELYICYYGLGESSRRQTKCKSNDVYNAFYIVVAVIPFWLRFLQCLRQLWEDRDAERGYNGLKYFLTIVAVVLRTTFELRKGRTWMALAFVSSAVATMMNTYWDIVVDWGLLRRKSKNPFLRDKLVISHKSVYFAAMALDILLRIAWMQMIVVFNLTSFHKMAWSTLISCLEVIRRGIWNFFRLENEHLNNVGKFRAFKSVPLPFNYYDTDGDNDSDMDSDKDD